MVRDFSDPVRSAPGGIRAERQSAVLVTRRGWRAQDWLERRMRDAMLAQGPLPADGGPRQPVYAAFPWSAYIDTLERPDVLEAPLLRNALRTLALLVPQGVAAVTVCQHPQLPAHLPRLAAAGITDLFWIGDPATAGPLPSGLRLHSFPALPAPDAPPVTGEGPGAAFAFCPAENGGNTPRLWGAVAAGLIPVLPLTLPALPGPAALWQAGAVLYAAGTDPAGHLEAIAAAPDRLEAMRTALAGLWLIHGGGGPVHDILLCLLERGRDMPLPPAPSAAGSLLWPLIRRFRDQPRLTPAEAQLVLQQASIDLLCGNEDVLALSPGAESAAAWRLVAQARAALPPTSPDSARLDVILGNMRDRNRLPLGAPARGRASSAPMRVFLLGPRGQRTPLSYAPIWPHLGGRIAFAETPEAADLIVTGWSRDLEDHAGALAGLCGPKAAGKAGGPQLAVLSEEPLWDSLWSGAERDGVAGNSLAARDRVLESGTLRLRYRHLNHVNSGIFAFRHLPWFVLSADSFPARYAALIAGFAAMRPRELLRHWAAAPLQAAFLAERRTGGEYHAAFPAEGVAGLCLYRSRVAELTPGARVLRMGQGWPGSGPRRQDLPDWHLDKLARLHGRLRVCGAYENTLHRDYITEKPFDAFAVGAVPAVLADAGHRLFDLILPEAMLNTVMAPPDLAAARIAALTPDLILAEAWLETAKGLLSRFRDLPRIREERQRIADACIHELRGLLADPPAAAAPP